MHCPTHPHPTPILQYRTHGQKRGIFCVSALVTQRCCSEKTKMRTLAVFAACFVASATGWVNTKVQRKIDASNMIVRTTTVGMTTRLFPPLIPHHTIPHHHPPYSHRGERRERRCGQLRLAHPQDQHLLHCQAQGHVCSRSTLSAATHTLPTASRVPTTRSSSTPRSSSPARRVTMLCTRLPSARRWQQVRRCCSR